jgi:PAS domain S-box-containing protein
MSIERISYIDETLNKLCLSYKNLTFTDFQELAHVLVKKIYLSLLDVSGNSLDERSIEILTHIPYITSLIAICCKIDDTGAKILARNKILTNLDISKNHISEKGAISLGKNTTLLSLNLFHNRIGDKGAEAIAKSFTLKTLNIGYNSVHTEGISAFERNTVLISLVASGNAIDLEGIGALSRNFTLTSLDFSYNNINDEMAATLANHPLLIYLDLSYNQIGFKGANALGGNRKLETLIISHNHLGDNGVIALARHHTITKLDVARNRIGFAGAMALSQNKKLTSLVLNFNLLGDPGAITLSYNNTLEELFLSYNHISDQGAIALAENNTLKVLNLNFNNIGEVGKKELAKNTTFSLLIISPEQPPEFTEDNLETIFLLSESFLCISLTGIIQFFNPVFSRILGYTGDELLAQPSWKFLHPDDRKNFEVYLENKQKGFGVEQVQNRYCCKDGSYRFIQWSMQIKHNHIYAVGTDITEKQQLETDLALIKMKNMEIRLYEYERFTQQQTEFIAQLSHEIRNPLMGVYGFTEIILDNIKSISNILNTSQFNTFVNIKEKIENNLCEMKDQMKDMITCLDYQKTIMDDNLDLAKITEKKLILKKEPLDLTQEMQEVINMLKVKATNKGIDIQYKFPEIIRVKGDAIRIKQILVNLITNAIKFTLKGRIDIVLEQQVLTSFSRLIKIIVIDTGIGISPDELKNLFQRFSQVSGCEYGGSGLGLHLMKILIELMGGKISVTSKKDIGSVFNVIIPFDSLTEEENKNFEQKSIKLPVIPSVVRVIPPSKQKILIVDDNEFNRKVISMQLIKEGYDCKLANNGIEALEFYEKQIFDMILMDIIMPIMDGITATREIRKREQEKKLPRTPIIAISANALERDRIDILNSGIDDIISKPFKKVEILEKIEKLNHRKFFIQTHEDWQIPMSSPLNNLHQLQSTLNNITSGKKWGINLDERIWLELKDEEEVENIMNHFKKNDYHAIEYKYQVKMDRKVPIIFLKEIDYTKLKMIPPIKHSPNF